MKLDLTQLSPGDYRLTVHEGGGYTLRPTKEYSAEALFQTVLQTPFDARGRYDIHRPKVPTPLAWMNSPQQPLNMRPGDSWLAPNGSVIYLTEPNPWEDHPNG